MESCSRFYGASLVATSFKLFPMNKEYSRLEAAEDIQFGTDKELENIISYLEERLKIVVNSSLISPILQCY